VLDISYLDEVNSEAVTVRGGYSCARIYTYIHTQTYIYVHI